MTDDKSRKQDERLEALLDSMLSAYSDVEARPGLETRVLATLSAGNQKSSRPAIRWLWSIGGSCAAAGLLFAAWFWQIALLPSPPATGFNAPAPRPTLPSPATRGNRHPYGIARVNHLRPVVPPDIRQEVFPSRTPLSEQERALLQYLQGTPREEIVAQSHPDPPAPPPEDGDAPQPQSQQVKKSESYNTR